MSDQFADLVKNSGANSLLAHTATEAGQWCPAFVKRVSPILAQRGALAAELRKGQEQERGLLAELTADAMKGRPISGAKLIQLRASLEVMDKALVVYDGLIAPTPAETRAARRAERAFFLRREVEGSQARIVELQQRLSLLAQRGRGHVDDHERRDLTNALVAEQGRLKADARKLEELEQG